MSGNCSDAHTGPSFSSGNRLMRVLWQSSWLLLCRWTPPAFHCWRALVLRLFGGNIARGTHVYPGVRIWAPWNLEIGEEAGVANGVILYNQGKISIGRRAVISQGAHLCTGTHNYNRAGFPLLTKPIIVKDLAWIAAEAFIHPGVTIGEGAVIGARSVVTRDMPAWTVCAGNPCQPIKERERI